MGKIYDNVLQLIGNTPMLHLNKIEQAEGLKAHLYAKVEGLNPGGSVKDRAALNMIEAAETEGKLKPGGRIVEGTSGNTGIGIARVSAVKKYRATICMQEGSSNEKIRILKAYGSEVVLTPKQEGFGRAGSYAKELEEKEGAMLEGTVDVSEMMGSSVHLHITAEGRDCIVIVPTLNTETDDLGGGAKVRFTFAPNAIHVFDPETEKNLEKIPGVIE